MNRAAANRWLFSALVDVVKNVYGYGAVPTAVIVAQAMHETGNFTSDIYRENNNAFGMKEPRQRPTTATGTRRGHATYSGVWSGLADYFMRQAYFKIPNTSDAAVYMADTVNSNYATDAEYLAKWKRAYREL